MDISATILHRLLQSGGKAENLTRIYPGHKLRFGFDQQNGLVALEYIPSKTEQLIFIRKDDLQYTVDHVFKQPEIKLRYRSAILEDSLFMAGQKAGIDQGLIMQMANIFSGVVDFVYDPRKGDSFDILYEEEFLEGEKIGNGSILTASYSNEDETYTAYRYEFADGRSGYFNEDGVSMRKPFLRTPVDFARISSGFNLRRKHPIHKKIKAHRGIDYAAPRGTPVFAVGDARVQRAGFSRANGNYVFLQHGPTYVTKYLHLDKRYVKTGQKVKQRTVIGTVGSTGYSTGPHLHYEFLVNGVHRNPRTIFKKLPSAEPVPEDEKQRFKDQVTYLKLQYDNHKL
jgi:murein DD-endopeptidase MepM/ murein hydrolase activator NlpD